MKIGGMHVGESAENGLVTKTVSGYIDGKTRTMVFSYTQDIASDLKAVHNIDLGAEVVDVLRSEFAREQVIASVRNSVRGN